MFKISINKEIFENVLLKKINIIRKDASKYWKNELFQPIIKDDKITYNIRQFEKIILTNGLGNNKPQIVVECMRIDYSIDSEYFEFYIGKVMEQKNINISVDEKDKFIEQLLKEKVELENKLKEKVKMIQQKMDF